MALPPCYVLLLLSAWAPSASPSPRHTTDSTLPSTLESSGGGPPEPPGLLPHRHGAVKVVRLDHPGLPVRSGLFKRAPWDAHRGGGLRSPFPAFLSRGRAAGPAGGQAGAPLHPPREKESARGLESRKRQGLQMWQQAVSKEQHSGKVSLELSLKQARQQTCSAIAFPQVTTNQSIYQSINQSINQSVHLLFKVQSHHRNGLRTLLDINNTLIKQSDTDIRQGKARQLYLYSNFHTQGRLKVLHVETLSYNKIK